jgi:hypothetical protein
LKLPAGLIQGDLSKVCSGQSVTPQHWVNVCLTDKTNNYILLETNSDMLNNLEFRRHMHVKINQNKVAEKKKQFDLTGNGELMRWSDEDIEYIVKRDNHTAM